MTEQELWEKTIVRFRALVGYERANNGYPAIYNIALRTHVDTSTIDWFALSELIKEDPNLNRRQGKVWADFPEAKDRIDWVKVLLV